MGLNEILQNLILTVVLIMLLFIFADYVSASSKEQLERRIVQLNRHEAVLVKQRDKYEVLLRNVDSALRQLNLRRESMEQIK
tara:strand:- start:156 stop:401 length:246 start_codon:yes stop_codon:yes gene_type:complete